MLNQSLPESGGVLQNFTAVMQLIKSVYRTFSKASGFQTFFLEAAEHLFTAFGGILPWFDYPCSIVPLYLQNRAENKECREAIGSLSSSGERKVPINAAFLKGRDDLPLENAIYCLYSHLNVCHPWSVTPTVNGPRESLICNGTLCFSATLKAPQIDSCCHGERDLCRCCVTAAF